MTGMTTRRVKNSLEDFNSLECQLHEQSRISRISISNEALHRIYEK